MTKATLKRRDGTVVTIEGSPEELKRFLALDEQPGKPPVIQPREKGKKGGAPKSLKEKQLDAPDLTAVVNNIKNCKEAPAIGENILDRTSLVDRTLLPLFIVHEFMGNEFGLTSGEISKILADLGIRVTQPNVSKTLAGSASKYVLGDKTRVSGVAVRYKLSRRGVGYLKEVISEKSDGKS